MTAQELITSGLGTIVDVSSYLEFSGGHIADSTNVPLDQLNSRLKDLQSLEKPLILVCASGNRSGMAQDFLSKNGIECINGGSWLSVNYFVSLK